jgi:hypothetical protein
MPGKFHGKIPVEAQVLGKDGQLMFFNRLNFVGILSQITSK